MHVWYVASVLYRKQQLMTALSALLEKRNIIYIANIITTNISLLLHNILFCNGWVERVYDPVPF